LLLTGVMAEALKKGKNLFRVPFLGVFGELSEV
jgi:hypothetical protein